MISATVFGHLGANAEVRVTQGGTSVLSLRVASNSRQKVGGEWQKVTDWIRVSMFGERGAKLAQHLTKGSAIVVRGELNVREYLRQDGTKGFSIEMRADDIEFAGGDRDNGRPQTKPAEPAHANGGEDDESLPF